MPLNYKYHQSVSTIFFDKKYQCEFIITKIYSDSKETHVTAIYLKEKNGDRRQQFSLEFLELLINTGSIVTYNNETEIL